MPHVVRSALVPYSAEKMYALVDDILAYPRFLPWCRHTTVLSRTESEVKACIDVAKGGFDKSFTTLNRVVPNRTIEMNLVDGPFKKLHGQWDFQVLAENASKVILDIEFEFSNKITSMVMGPIFNQAIDTLVDSFVARAQEVYGKSV